MAAALLEEFGASDVLAREESWRYSKTALRALAQQDFIAADGQAAVSAALRERFEWAQTDGCRLVFVNGVFAPAYSDTSRVGPHVEISHNVDNHLLIAISGDCTEPLHLVYVNAAASSASRWQASSEIRIDAGKLDLIEQHVGEAGPDVLGALRSDIRIAAAAHLQMTTLAELPDSASMYRRVQTAIASQGICRTTHAIVGARLQRYDLGVELAGALSRFESQGVFALGGRQHADIHLDVRHVARDTACDIVWRGVADQRARGVFHGAITVAAGADGADAQLSNKNLLLSAQAEIDTQPVLEIHADEVKAAHGATVGQLDEQALFYLRSRGLPADAARRLLIGAFCRSVFAQAPADLRERLESAIDARIPSARAADA
jgi:Fe-S cluster assembly protein SufD